MNRMYSTLAVGAIVLALAAGGCGGTADSPASESQVTAAVRSSAREMEPEGDRDEVTSRFRSALNQLRDVPVLAPLFDLYRVPNPIEMDDDDHSGGLVDLLRAVKFAMSGGTLAISNRDTGGVIYTAPMRDLAAGVFYAENLPGGTAPPPPTTCTSFTYSPWGACQSSNTQTRTVLTSSPSGCTAARRRRPRPAPTSRR